MRTLLVFEAQPDFVEYTCRLCKGRFRGPLHPSVHCLVAHMAGTCCHYGEIPIQGGNNHLDDGVPRINGIDYSPESAIINGSGNYQEADMAGGPGRPAIGPQVNIRLSEELIVELDIVAATHEISRAELVRVVLDDFVAGHRTKHTIQRLLREGQA